MNHMRKVGWGVLLAVLALVGARNVAAQSAVRDLERAAGRTIGSIDVPMPGPPVRVGGSSSDARPERTTGEAVSRPAHDPAYYQREAQAFAKAREANGLYSAGRYEDALQRDLEAQRIMPYLNPDLEQNIRNDRMMILFEKADGAFDSGDFDSAAYFVAQAMSANPRYAYKLKDFQALCVSHKLTDEAKACLEKGNSGKAIRILNQALRVNPNNTWASQLMEAAARQQKLTQTANVDIKFQKTQVKTLCRDIRSIVPPLPEPKKIHEGVILGLMNTQTQNLVTSMNLKSPFHDPRAEDKLPTFATTDDMTNRELGRGFVDNQTIGRFTLNTEYGKKLVAELNGTHFDRLIAHSNGATVSEALIKEGVITVDELNIIGGDRSYVNWVAYNRLLAEGKVKRLVVWVNPADLVPYGSSLAPIFFSGGTAEAEFVKDLGSLIYNKLMGAKSSNGVEFRFLKGPQYKRGQSFPDKKSLSESVWDPHAIDAYFENIRIWFETHGGDESKSRAGL